MRCHRGRVANNRRRWRMPVCVSISSPSSEGCHRYSYCPLRNGRARAMDKQSVVDHTRRWISAMVIGLNLCPFARRVYMADTIAYLVTDAEHEQTLIGTGSIPPSFLDQPSPIYRHAPGRVAKSHQIHIMGAIALHS